MTYKAGFGAEADLTVNFTESFFKLDAPKHYVFDLAAHIFEISPEAQ